MTLAAFSVSVVAARRSGRNLPRLCKTRHLRRQLCCAAENNSDSCSDLGLLDRLQGDWEDDVGNVIRISGNQAHFNDGSGAWPILQSEDGELHLRGTKFVGTAENPMWRFQNGVERSWVRPREVTDEDRAWRDVFHEFKVSRSQLRRRIWAAVVSEEFEEAAALQEEWKHGVAVLSSCSTEQQDRLLPGKCLVPGVCFLHRRYGYRAVVISAEPWCTATETWKRVMGVAGLPHGEVQPFYHCLVDERDRPGGQTTFVGEENIISSDEVFPVENKHINYFFVPVEELGGYMPTPRLEDALRRQRSNGAPFDWRLGEEMTDARDLS